MELMANQFRSVRQNFLARLAPPEPPQAAAAEEAASFNHVENGVGWFLLIIGYCLTSAIAIALEYWELSADGHHHQIPLSLLLLSVALILAFAATVAAKLVSNHGHARLLERVGIVLVCMSFLVAITAPFPLYLKFISWFVFVASFLALLLFMLFPRHDQ